VETEHGRDLVALADERASNGEHEHRPKPPRHSSTLPGVQCPRRPVSSASCAEGIGGRPWIGLS
jgi:hypothetical protein